MGEELSQGPAWPPLRKAAECAHHIHIDCIIKLPVSSKQRPAQNDDAFPLV